MKLEKDLQAVYHQRWPKFRGSLPLELHRSPLNPIVRFPGRISKPEQLANLVGWAIILRSPDSMASDKVGCLPAPTFRVATKAGIVTREGDAMPTSEESFPVWQQINHQLVESRTCRDLEALNSEHASEILRLQERASTESRDYPRVKSQIFEAEVKRFKRYIETYYKNLRYVWEQVQRQKATPDFILAVRQALLKDIRRFVPVLQERLKANAYYWHGANMERVQQVLQDRAKELRLHWLDEMDILIQELRYSSSTTAKTPDPKKKRALPESVAMRTGIVKAYALSNPSLKGKGLDKETCIDLDERRVDVPPNWRKEFGVGTWVESYENEVLRNRIGRMFSADRTRNI